MDLFKNDNVLETIYSFIKRKNNNHSLNFPNNYVSFYNTNYYKS